MGRIGIIGGSGLYELEGLKPIEEVTLNTPYGEPSANFFIGELSGKEIVFLPRHGKHHQINPSAINYRANIYGMKKLGVKKIISVSACGSLKEKYKPLDFLIPTQFVDRTNQARKHTFFEQGITVHVGFAHPVCRNLSKLLLQAAENSKITAHYGGTYVNIEGPQFSTLAESKLYRSWNMDVVGMTNMPEARLAREAEICYVCLTAVTDYDCWHPDHETVTLEEILSNLQKNVTNSKKLLREFIALVNDESCQCNQALKDSIVTRPEFISQDIKNKLSLIIDKYIK